MDATSRMGGPDKPGKPDKPDKKDKPGKPDKPDKPDKPERTDRPSGKAKDLELDRTTPELRGLGGDTSGVTRVDNAAPTENDEAKRKTSTIGRTPDRRRSQLPFILLLVLVALAAAAVGLYIGGVIRI